MVEKISEIPNENPIFCVIFVLGYLSSITAYFVTGIVNESPLTFMDTTILGIICGLCSLPLGFKLVNFKQIKESDILSTS